MCGEHESRPGRFARHDRFIPACAGNTRCPACGYGADPVHPRVCGEHTVRGARAVNVGGSSPRVRGTLADHLDGGTACRFIPACAGNTTQASCETCRSAVHPRVCGEHRRFAWGGFDVDGSSPRVRGTQLRLPSAPASERFIPACAGNTSNRTTRSPWPTGSSPRVRGTRHSAAGA